MPGFPGGEADAGTGACDAGIGSADVGGSTAAPGVGRPIPSGRRCRLVRRYRRDRVRLLQQALDQITLPA